MIKFNNFIRENSIDLSGTFFFVGRKFNVTFDLFRFLLKNQERFQTIIWTIIFHYLVNAMNNEQWSFSSNIWNKYQLSFFSFTQTHKRSKTWNNGTNRVKWGVITSSINNLILFCSKEEIVSLWIQFNYIFTRINESSTMIPRACMHSEISGYGQLVRFEWSQRLLLNSRAWICISKRTYVWATTLFFTIITLLLNTLGKRRNSIAHMINLHCTKT